MFFRIYDVDGWSPNLTRCRSRPRRWMQGGDWLRGPQNIPAQTTAGIRGKTIGLLFCIVDWGLEGQQDVRMVQLAVAAETQGL